MTKLLFLHGIGDGGLTSEWQSALNAALASQGYGALDPENVIEPRYPALHKQEPSPSCPMPEQTVAKLTAEEEGRERREYARRQATLERFLNPDRKGGSEPPIPDPVLNWVIAAIAEARHYVAPKNEGLRGCVLQTILDKLPRSGELVSSGTAWAH